MGFRTLAQMRTFARNLVADVNTTTPALDDLVWNELINEAMDDLGCIRPETFTKQVTTVNTTPGSNTVTSAVGEQVRYPVSLERSILPVKAPLERVSLTQIKTQIEEVPKSAAPKMWAFNELDGDPTTWSFLLWPTPDTLYTYLIIGSVYPDELTNDGDKCKYGQAEGRWVARMAAYRGGSLIGRDETKLSAIAQPLPDDLRAYVMKRDRMIRPKSETREEMA